MRTRTDKIEGPFRIEEDLALNGMIAGDATVAGGSTLHLHGMVTGDLLVEPGGLVELRGMVSGSVYNEGRLTLWGTIIGSLKDIGAGASNVAPGAVIRNESDG